jgi:hypothetical protein
MAIIITLTFQASTAKYVAKLLKLEEAVIEENVITPKEEVSAN